MGDFILIFFGNLWSRAVVSSRSIVVRLILFGISVVIIGTILRMLFLMMHLKEPLIEVSAAHQLSIAQYVAKDIDSKIATRRDLVSRFAASLPVSLLSDPQALEAWLRERQDINPLFSLGFIVVSAESWRVLADYPLVPGRRDLDFSKTPHVLAARDTGRTVIGKPVRGLVNNEPLLPIVAPIMDANGQTAGVLIGITALAAPGFLNVLQDTQIGRSGGFLLISPEDNLFVAATDTTKILTALPPPGMNLLHDRAMAGFRGAGVTTNAQGVEELSAIASVPTTGWFLVARVPTDEALEAMEGVPSLVIGGSFITSFVIIVFVALVLRRFFRPLTQAAQQMHRMANEEIEIAPLPIGRRDEVGELAVGFNYLLGKLRQKEEALRQSEALMAHLAHHDKLTGLPNRTLFEDRLGQALARAERSEASFALLYMDMDGFKFINDTYGHEAGDEVLRQAAQRLSAVVRKGDTVARIGGDEFAILLVDVEDAAFDAALVADKCRNAIAPEIMFAGHRLEIGLSIGIAAYPKDGRNAAALISHADRAMYETKKGGAKISEAKISGDYPPLSS